MREIHPDGGYADQTGKADGVRFIRPGSKAGPPSDEMEGRVLPDAGRMVNGLCAVIGDQARVIRTAQTRPPGRCEEFWEELLAAIYSGPPEMRVAGVMPGRWPA